MVKGCLESVEIRAENPDLKGEHDLKYQSEKILGKSLAMRVVFNIMTRVANDDKATVLITGETGTGKGLIARTIHDNSARKDNSFVHVNCAAIPEGLLESEFFGHEKGAFTGAIAGRSGRFEVADNGTLFLDEVVEMNARLQGKLLRVIEAREFERVGGSQTIRVNLRIIAATNKNLQEEVKSGRFREDLFYRLNVIPIHVPPLRERLEDIAMLVDHCLEKFHQKGRKRVQILPEALQILTQYRYPGNIRELENLLERTIVLGDGRTITPNDLYFDPEVRFRKSTPEIKTFKDVGREAIEAAEKTMILKALLKNNWNRSRVAEDLEIDSKTLRIKIKKYQIV